LIKNSLNWSGKKILVTGGNGFLGSHVVDELKNLNVKDIFTPASKDYDLRNRTDCKKVLKDIDVVFHLASTSGGIMFMKERPAEAFYDNIMMGTQLLHEAKNSSVEKFIALGTVCSYPKFASIPFLENEIWDGFPDETNAPYGISKKMMLVQSDAYRRQYGFNSITVIPTNLYGPEDDFNIETSSVIPGIILKISNAVKTGSNEVVLWGDGSPTRDFLFVDDATDGIILAAQKYDDVSPINLGAQKETSIKELATLVSEIMRFSGDIIWDNTKANGQPRRCVSNYKAEREIGFKPKISLKEGLTKVISWFESNYG
jgi:GDP-L-fucose synthase